MSYPCGIRTSMSICRPPIHASPTTLSARCGSCSASYSVSATSRSPGGSSPTVSRTTRSPGKRIGSGNERYSRRFTLPLDRPLPTSDWYPHQNGPAWHSVAAQAQALSGLVIPFATVWEPCIPATFAFGQPHEREGISTGVGRAGCGGEPSHRPTRPRFECRDRCASRGGSDLGSTAAVGRDLLC